MSLIRKWLNLEKEAETQGQILSLLLSFPLLFALAAWTLQKSEEAHVPETRMLLTRDSQCEPQPRVLAAARDGCWVGMLEHL